MSILTILIVLVVVGLALYLINRFVPMDAKVKTILNWAVIIVLVIWLLKGLGALSFLSNTRI